MGNWIDVPITGLELPDCGVEPHHEVSEVPRHSRTTNDPQLYLDSDAVARFWRHVVKSPSCWFWTGAISSPDGYGRFTWQRNGRTRSLSAHRVALLVSGYPLDAGSVGDHECNEPLCVRVGAGHVRVATQAENIGYAVSLGRHRGNRPAVVSTNRVERSRKIRAALANGWDETRFLRAVSQCGDEPTLF